MRKRGPKGPRQNYELALVAMAPLVARGLTVSAAARVVIGQGKIKCSVDRLRKLFAARKPNSVSAGAQAARPALLMADLAWEEALCRAICRSPRLLLQLSMRPMSIAPYVWERIRVEARQIERMMRFEKNMPMPRATRLLEEQIQKNMTGSLGKL